VFALLAKISPEQLDEWMAYDGIEPIGPTKLYGMLALHGANLAIAQGCEIPPARFYPRTPEDDAADDEPMSDEETQATFQRFAQ
jgi:hypothetical protein